MTELAILYQDASCVAIDKPDGLLVHPSRIDAHERRTALGMLQDQLGQRLHTVHRLDKPTSGVLLFAVTPAAARELGRQFRERAVHKTYLAVVRGFCEPRGRIERPLHRVADVKQEVARVERAEPLEALTDFETLLHAELNVPVGRYPTARYSVLQLRPTTGRKHQLRRHLKHVSHPIVGDRAHGDRDHNRFYREQLGIERLLLMASRLELRHPETGEPLTIETRPQGQFLKALNVLRTRSRPSVTPDR